MLGTPDQLDALIAALDSAHVDPLLAFAAADGSADDFLAALLKDPRRAKTVLGHGLEPKELHGLAVAAKQDLEVVDDVLAITRPGKDLDPLDAAGLQRVTRAAKKAGKSSPWKTKLTDAAGDDASNTKPFLREAADLEDADVIKMLGGQTRPPKPAAPSYKARREMISRGKGKLETREAYTVGGMPRKDFFEYLKKVENWIAERVADQDRWIAEARKHAQAFADAQQGPATIYAMRGNTAVGKTRAIREGHIPVLKDAVKATDGLNHRALNPDNYKVDIRADAAADALSSQQVHWESSAVAFRAEKDIVHNLQRTDGSPASVLVDKRLASVREVNDYAALAKETGKAFHLVDIDAPLQNSLAGVLMRAKNGADGPIPTFDVVASGFEACRGARREVIDGFRKDASRGTYELFATLPDGSQRKVAQVVGGKRTIYDRELYADVRNPAGQVAALRHQVITERLVDAMVADLPKKFGEKMRDALKGYHGKTWEQALSAHGTAVKQGTP